MTVQMLDVDVEEMSLADARRAFDATAQRLLGVSGVEFLEALDRGDYDGDDREEVLSLRILAPFGR